MVPLSLPMELFYCLHGVKYMDVCRKDNSRSCNGKKVPQKAQQQT